MTWDSGTTELLQLLRERDGATRAELLERLGWARSTLAARLETLARAGLVATAGEADSTGGRPAARLAFNGAAGVVLAAALGTAEIEAAVVDLAGVVEAHEIVPQPVADGPQATLERLAGSFDTLLARAGRTRADVWGVGAGVPGPVDFAEGRPLAPPSMPGWDGFPVAAWLAEHYARPALVDNDANLMALAERAVARPSADQLIFVKTGTGMSAGLIADGHLHRGANGVAGNIGHLYVPGHDDVLCECGNVGCLEAVVGERALAERLSGDIVELVRRGDPRAMLAIREAGRELGHGLAGLVNAFNPSVLVIGGTLAGTGDHLLAGVCEVVYRRSPPLATSALEIVRSGVEKHACVTGAALMITAQALSTAAPTEARVDAA
jgi:predicted NBD/HSP70 family sugar kinase